MGSSEVEWTHDSALADLTQHLVTELEKKVLRYKLALKDRLHLEWSWQEELNRGGMECTILAHINTGTSALSIQNKRHLHWRALESIPVMNNEVEFLASTHSLLLKTGSESSDRQAHKNRIASIQASPQAARKKRYTKLDLATIDPPRTVSVTRPLNAQEAKVEGQDNPNQDPHKALGSVHQPPEIASPMSERPLTFASLNVKGLRVNSPKQKEIKTWLASLRTPPQILLIQEHHLGKENISNAGKGIEYWKGSSFWNPGIPMGRSQRTSAGTAILVDRMTAPLVKENGILMEGRAQYITLQLTNNGSLTIINVYAARSSNDRTPMWKMINQAEFASDHIILGGDFNHLEETTRRRTSGERQMHRREAASWHHKTLHYGLSDA
ncbi:unnamed protein product, partial [Sphagnum compactum]